MATSRSGRSSGTSSASFTKNLKGVDFPASKQDLFQHAKHSHAEKVVLDEIQRMDDRQYSSMADVMKSFEPMGEGKGRSTSSSSTSSSSGSRSHSSGSESKSSSSHGGSSSHGKSHR